MWAISLKDTTQKSALCFSLTRWPDFMQGPHLSLFGETVLRRNGEWVLGDSFGLSLRGLPPTAADEWGERSTTG